MAPTPAQARAHPRAQKRVRVEYHYGSVMGVGWTNDISEGGISLYAEHTAPAGSRIYLRIYLSDDPATQPLKVIGMVKRTQRGGDDNQPVGMGIHFEVAYSRTREQLSSFMHNMLVCGQLGPDDANAHQRRSAIAAEASELASEEPDTLGPRQTLASVEEEQFRWKMARGGVFKLMLLFVVVALAAYLIRSGVS